MKRKQIVDLITAVSLIIVGSLIYTIKDKEKLLETSQEKQNYSISEIKEKIEAQIEHLREVREDKGETLEIEDLLKINDSEMDVRNIRQFPVEVYCQGYKFEIDSNFNVEYIGETDGTMATYTINSEDYNVLIKIVNEKGIKTVEYPNGNKLSANGKKTIAIDYKPGKNGVFTFTIIDNQDNKIEKDILVYDMNLLPIVTSETANKNGYIFSASDYYGPNMPWHVSDNNSNTAWAPANRNYGEHWLMIEFPTTIIVNRYELVGMYSWGNVPSFLLQASNDKETWDNLEKELHVGSRYNPQTYNINLENKNAYKYYRIYTPAGSGWTYGISGCAYIYSLKMYGY